VRLPVQLQRAMAAEAEAAREARAKVSMHNIYINTYDQFKWRFETVVQHYSMIL